MKDYIIMTDSGCDLPQNLVDQFNIKVVPMGLTIDGKAYKHYHDFRELSKEKFYSLIRGGHIGTTSGVNIQDAIDAMTDEASQGKDILFLSFASVMSSSYQYVCAAAEEVRERFPNVLIEVIDTKAGCLGLGLLAYMTAMNKADGYSFDDAVNYAKEHYGHMCHFFMVDDLQYIQKSGRISHLRAMIGTLLKIKPIFKLNNAGAVTEATKVRGTNAGINYMIQQLHDHCDDKTTIFIAHADVEPEALTIKHRIQDIFPDANIIVHCLGPILGNNTGPGTLAILFHGAQR